MGQWDELCVLSGIGPEGGPPGLFNKSQLQDVASTMATDILNATNLSIFEADLKSIIQKALPLVTLRDPICLWPGSQTCIGIGHFDRHGECPKGWVTAVEEERNVENARILSGDDIEVRTVHSSSWENGGFHVMERLLPSGKLKKQQQMSDCNCRMHDSVSNFFILAGCWIYLQAWLDVSLQPRLSSYSGKPLSLAGEFYEIINSRRDKRRCAYRSRTSILSTHIQPSDNR
jgi:hypothetical protein